MTIPFFGHITIPFKPMTKVVITFVFFQQGSEPLKRERNVYGNGM